MIKPPLHSKKKKNWNFYNLYQSLRKKRYRWYLKICVVFFRSESPYSYQEIYLTLNFRKTPFWRLPGLLSFQPFFGLRVTERVDETKPPSRNAFLVNLFAGESQKEFRNDERTLFWDSSRSADLSLNPWPPNDAIWPFPGLLSFQPFLAPSCCFQKKRPNPFDSALNFT